MAALVIVEHDNNNMHATTANMLAAALQLDDTPTFLVIGHACMGVAEQVALMHGVGTVLVVDAPCYMHQLAENMADLITTILLDEGTDVDAILAPSSTFGKNLLPRIAANLDCVQVSDVTRIVGLDTFEHPIYAGNALQIVQILDKIKVLTIRTTSFDKKDTKQSPCAIKSIAIRVESKASKFIELLFTKTKRPDLSAAKIVVAGGRGLQSVENFKLIEELADALGAAVGASRAAVDAGFVSNDHQVGQTGKIIAPSLYFAIGISGAVQHLAGMKDAKIIIAINKDEAAPIFEVADYGLVGDLFTLVPELIAALKNRT